jgi:hypothetical protein
MRFYKKMPRPENPLLTLRQKKLQPKTQQALQPE